MKPGAWKARVGTFARQLALPAQRQLFDYWINLCTDESWPLREELRPSEIKPLLPHLSLMEVKPLPEGVEVRLAGSALWDIYGGELTGSTLVRGCWGQHLDYWRDIYAMLAEAHVPMNGHLRNVNGSEHAALFWLRLPLQSRDGGPWLLGLDITVSISQLDTLLQRHAEEMGPPPCDFDPPSSSSSQGGGWA